MNGQKQKLSGKFKATVTIVILVAGFFGVKALAERGIIKLPGMSPVESVVPQKADLPTVKDNVATPAAAAVPVKAADLATDVPVANPGKEVRYEIMAWNSQFGLILANGGPVTTQGSLMEKHGVTNLRLIRQDDCNQMMTDLITFATALKEGKDPGQAPMFVAVMGDGTAAFLAGLNEALVKLGDDYQAEIIASAGFSRGEDKFMGPQEWKDNPNAARGSLIAGYLRDGDWNIALKWAGDNNIPNNPDEKTWDPDALNWVAAKDFLDAAEKYFMSAQGYCEERKVVKKGKLTGEKKTVCVNGVVTWTPGDVNVAMKKGGLVSIVSTKEYRAQMPNAVIGIKKWNQANRALIEEMIAAIAEAGDQIKSSPLALAKAGELSAKTYNEQDGAYWAKYYRGTTEPDVTGVMVELGGSYANNMADMEQVFGLAPGSANLMKATYVTFGDIVKQQYPTLVPQYPPADEVINASYTKGAKAKIKVVQAAMAKPDLPVFQPSEAKAPVAQVVSRKSWSIEFKTGSADFTQASLETLDRLFNDLVVAGSLAVELHGHTDNVGNADMNMALSEKRAFAVKTWLEGRSSTNFPEGRIRVFAHGQQAPIAPNDTVEGKAKNRRVEIVLGTTK